MTEIELSNIIEAIAEGVVVIDAGWKVKLWNNSARDLVGFSQEQLLDKDFREQVKVIRQQDRVADYGEVEKALTDGKKHHQTDAVILLTKSQNELRIIYSVSPLFDREGKVSGAVMVFRDLAGDKDVFHLKSDFTYLQHQLRTPLVAALWNLQTLASSSDLAEKDRAQIADALVSMESVRVLFDRLIDVSQVDQGLIDLKDSLVMVGEIVDLAIVSIKQLADTKSISIIVGGQSQDQKITTDLTYAAKILEELLKNAIQYSHENNEIKLNISHQSDGVLFEVVDQGIGIPLEETSMIFNKFFRGANISRTIPGAGLGLYLAMRYTKLLRGKIWFVSKVNQGSTFSFFLPI